MKKEAQQRKETPVYSGFIKYFPDAIKEVARVSFIGNEQHNPGKPLFWDRTKSKDELDALARHLIDAGTLDTDGVRHSAKVAWRAMANLQKELEKDLDKSKHTCNKECICWQQQYKQLHTSSASSASGLHSPSLEVSEESSAGPVLNSTNSI